MAGIGESFVSLITNDLQKSVAVWLQENSAPNSTFEGNFDQRISCINQLNACEQIGPQTTAARIRDSALLPG